MEKFQGTGFKIIQLKKKWCEMKKCVNADIRVKSYQYRQQDETGRKKNEGTEATLNK